MCARLEEFHQRGHDANGDDEHRAQADRQPGLQFLEGMGQPNFQFVQVVLGGKLIINQQGLGVHQHLGLDFRHARLGQTLHKRMGIKTNRAHLLH